MKRKSRQGVIGSLLDEYKNVIDDLKEHISDVSDSELKVIVDNKTKNKNCVSIQSILTHIVNCGFYYVTMMDIHKGNADSPWRKPVHRKSIPEYNNDLDEMYEYTIVFFERVKQNEMAQFDPAGKVLTFWGQIYDYEQMMEHAIVHVSRHRRQIQKFKKELRRKK